MNFKKIVLIVITTTTLNSFAHSGRTNSSGCHNDRKHGGYHCHSAPRQVRRVSSIQNSNSVIFNVKTYKYHGTSCAAAKACTKNCIALDKKEVMDRGGIPCSKCNGY